MLLPYNIIKLELLNKLINLSLRGEAIASTRQSILFFIDCFAMLAMTILAIQQFELLSNKKDKKHEKNSNFTYKNISENLRILPEKLSVLSDMLGIYKTVHIKIRTVKRNFFGD